MIASDLLRARVLGVLAAVPVGLGLAVGAAGAIAGARIVESVLHDSPARRAARIEPMSALRHP